jgi:spoIIIJ-associated protein
MHKNKTTLEVIAPTIEEAIDKGLSEMGLTEDDVEVEVLDEGKRNIFHFATRQARIRLTVKDSNRAIYNGSELTQSASQPVLEEAPKQVKPIITPDTGQEKISIEQQVAQDTTRELLEKMGVEANVKVDFAETEPSEKPVILVNIEGEDLSYLIGRKAETLNALQYLLSLIIAHKLNYWVPIQVDVQRYRTRRENELKKLARRAADQVQKTGRKQVLEPMPPNERRIVHMALRENAKVYTESTGEEPYRKVSVYPAEDQE